MKLAYLDTSAYVKTILEEPESDRLARWLVDWPQRASCDLLRTEAIRAVRRHGTEYVAAGRAGFRDLRLIELDDRLLDAAGELPVDVRSLDAIHLAAALALGADLGRLVTYDERMTTAARELGLEVVAP